MSTTYQDLKKLFFETVGPKSGAAMAAPAAPVAPALPRHSYAAVGIGSKLYVWGGYNSDSTISTTTLEIFDLPSITWEEPRVLQGSGMPDELRGMAVTSDGETAYSFGGRTGTFSTYTRNNTIFEITPSKAVYQVLQPTSSSRMAPEKTDDSCIVHFKDKLVLHGGWNRRTSEVHVFDLKKREWSVQATTGEGPPLLESHTFTKIDHHRAAVFGGYTGKCNLNNTYVLDMETWHWTKLKISGKKPPARYYHDTCCVAGPLTGQQHPLLMVVGGVGHVGDGYEKYNDVWLLDVDNGVWREITLPAAITPRYGHSAVVFGSGPSLRVVVLFGGKKSHPMSETTLLLLELRGGSWQVTRVVKPDELGRPDESLREQMRKLEFSLQQDNTLREEQEKRAEAEKEVQLLKQKLAELQTQSSVASGADSNTTSKDSSLLTHTDGAEVKTGPMIDFKDIQTGRKIGKGACGIVYEAKWKKKTVAVKACLGNLLESDTREIEILTSLPHHSNVITFYGVALSSDSLSTYIITELASHGSLYDYLYVKKNVPSSDQSLAWALQVATGMQHLHTNNVVHRDLKSGNVLLSLGLVAKVCDFGTARVLAQTALTNQKGTYRWMAPEIIRNVEANINRMCDVFSYGMVVYEIYDRKIPFAHIHGDVPAGSAIENGERPPVPDKLPAFLHPLLKACWEEKPNERPQFRAIVLAIQTGSFD